MRAFVRKRLDGSLVPADEASGDVVRKLKPGELYECDIATRKPRSTAWHRRYWLLCSMVHANCEGFRSVDEVHMVFKLETGLTKEVLLRSTGEMVRVPDSIAFDRMDPDAWADYWQRVVRYVHETLLPGVSIPEVEQEIARLAS